MLFVVVKLEEIHVYGASTFPSQKTHIPEDGMLVRWRKETQTAPQYVSGIEIHQQVEGILTIEELPGKEILGKRK